MANEIYDKLDEFRKKLSVNVAQYLFATIAAEERVELRTVLPLVGNDELCALLQTLMLEIVVEKTEEELPHFNNKIKLYQFHSFF